MTELATHTSISPRPTSLRQRIPMYDVLIIGAGAAGIGMGVVLQELGVPRFALLERHDVGASFERWPREMRFITPSFPSNPFGLMDLNAVALGTSPGYTLSMEHPSGMEYARYLRGVARHWQLPVHSGVDVTGLSVVSDHAGFRVITAQGVVRSRFVIWAAGEFQYPRREPFPGACLAIHSADVRSWRDLPEDAYAIIGGYESGIDAAYHLSMLGKQVHVFDAAPTWDTKSGDPSLALAPYTRERLQTALDTGRVELHFSCEITAIERTETGYLLRMTSGEAFAITHQPILATGFTGSLRLIPDLFDWSERGNALLSTDDESLRTPGVFVVGPLVRHPGAIFCFIYKFRQRFAVVGRAIAERLGLDQSVLEAYRTGNMLLDDLSCCDDACVC